MPAPMMKAKILHSAVFGFEKYRREISFFRALHGTWPQGDEDIMPFRMAEFGGLEDSRIDSSTLEDGAFHVRFKASRDVFFNLTCRPAILKNNKSGQICWSCGPGPPFDSDWLIQGNDKTTVEAFLIPWGLQ